MIRTRDDKRSVPGNPLKFSKMKFISNERFKSMNGGRINQQFHEPVPKLKDPEIRQLISQYPKEINTTESDD